MALTLIEAAKIAMGQDEVLKATIMELYARGSDVVAALPFEDIQGNALAFNREKTLPTVGFRAVNEAYSEGVGEVENVKEALAIAGGDIDVDKFLVDTGGPNQRAIQEGLKIKALSLSMAREIIKGDVTTTPKGIDGLQVRCLGDQLISNSITTSTAGISLNKLDEAIDITEDPTHLIMSKASRRRLTTAARTPSLSGTITYGVDAFGRRVTQYNDLPILIADRDNLNNYMLPFNESCYPGLGGGAINASLYVVSFADNGVLGIQNQPMQVRDLGELETKPVYRTRIEWYISLAILRPRAAARLRFIADAAATA